MYDKTDDDLEAEFAHSRAMDEFDELMDEINYHKADAKKWATLVAEHQKEIDWLREQFMKLHVLSPEKVREIEKKAEQRDELGKALSKYGHHIEGCGYGWNCTCGFYAALAKVGADKTGEK